MPTVRSKALGKRAAPVRFKTIQAICPGCGRRAEAVAINKWLWTVGCDACKEKSRTKPNRRKYPDVECDHCHGGVAAHNGLENEYVCGKCGRLTIGPWDKPRYA